MKKTTAFLALCACAASPAQSQIDQRLPPPDYLAPVSAGPGETAFDFRLSGYVFGVKMISARYKGVLDDESYQTYSDIKTSGLGAMLKKMRIWAVTNGHYDRAGLYPDSQTQQNMDKKSRRVEMRYDYGAQTVTVNINPPLGSQGVPPASPAERFAADDVLSGILNMMMQGYRLDQDFCSGDVKVFDSKQHYALRMVPGGTDKRKFNGEKYDAQICNVYYVPINGFDPEDLPEAEEEGTPVTLYYIRRDDLGLNIPIRATYKISGFKAVIKLKDMTIQQGASVKEAAQ